MDKSRNKWAVKTALMGCITVCAVSAGSILLGSGQRETVAHYGGNAVAGQRKYQQTCAACHGVDGQGQPHQGANLNASRFVRESSDEALVAFVKAGRAVGDPKSVLGLSMPPLGGNPTLEEEQLRDIVAYLRTLESAARAEAGATNFAGTADPGDAGGSPGGAK